MPADPADAIDPALASLAADPRVALRPPPPGGSIAPLRAAADAFLARARGPALADVADWPGGGAPPMRLYRPIAAGPLPTILFVHGGGFVFGDLDTHDATCRLLAQASGAAVAAVAYRLAPEHPYPAALNDVAAALDRIATEGAALSLDPGRLALAGDSAGAQLALVASSKRASVRHLALLYPLLDPLRRSASQRRFEDGPMLTGAFLDYAWASYRGAAAADHPDIAAAELDPSRLPPTTIVTCGIDPLRDEGEAFAARLDKAGSDVAHHRYATMIHGFAGLPQVTPLAAEAIGWIGSRIAASLAA